jgi:hypothetical protein
MRKKSGRRLKNWTELHEPGKQDFAQDPYGGVGSVVKKTLFFQETRTVTTPEGL